MLFNFLKYLYLDRSVCLWHHHQVLRYSEMCWSFSMIPFPVKKQNWILYFTIVKFSKLYNAIGYEWLHLCYNNKLAEVTTINFQELTMIAAVMQCGIPDKEPLRIWKMEMETNAFSASNTCVSSLNTYRAKLERETWNNKKKYLMSISLIYLIFLLKIVDDCYF